MAEIFTFFYDYQICLNLFHFQTDSYASHKASDAHLSKFREHFDRFLEVWQGAFGHINFEHPQQINISNVTSNREIIEHTHMINGYLNDLSKELTEINHTYLVNIIDEIIADNKQFIYLLTFT